MEIPSDRCTCTWFISWLLHHQLTFHDITPQSTKMASNIKISQSQVHSIFLFCSFLYLSIFFLYSRLVFLHLSMCQYLASSRIAVISFLPSFGHHRISKSTHETARRNLFYFLLSISLAQRSGCMTCSPYLSTSSLCLGRLWLSWFSLLLSRSLSRMQHAILQHILTYSVLWSLELIP